MGTINAGRAIPMLRGEYSATNEYKYLDIVTFEGQGYICRSKTLISNIDPTNTTNWMLFGTRGKDGDKGDPGDTSAAEALVADILDRIANLPDGSGLTDAQVQTLMAAINTKADKDAVNALALQYDDLKVTTDFLNKELSTDAINLNWVICGYNTPTGYIGKVTEGNRVGNLDFIKVSKGTIIESNFQLNVPYYTSNSQSTYVQELSDNHWSSGKHIVPQDGYVRLVARYSSNNENITESYKNEIINSIIISGGKIGIIETQIDNIDKKIDIIDGRIEETNSDVEDVKEQLYNIEHEIYTNNNIIPKDSRFDSLSVVNDINVGDWVIRYKETDSFSKDSEGIIVNLNGSSTVNASFWSSTHYYNSLVGKTIKVSFYIKGYNNSNGTVYFFANGASVKQHPVNFDSNWKGFELETVFGNLYSDARTLQIFANSEVSFYIKDMCIEEANASRISRFDELDNKISEEITNLDNKISEVSNKVVFTDELMPDNSRFDANTPVSSTAAGDWGVRYSDKTSFSSSSEGVTVNFSGGNTNNEAIWLLNNEAIKSKVGKEVTVSFDYKSTVAFNFLIGAIASGFNLPKSNEWKHVEETIVVGSQYGDARVMFYGTWSNPQTLDIKDLSILVHKDFKESISDIEDSVTEIKSDIVDIENSLLCSVMPDINLTMPNLRYKLACIEYGVDTQCVVGLIGDSWTQHTETHTNYVQPFAKYLRNKWGNAGGGFYSFSMSHSGTAKMASVDPDDADDTRSGNFTYRDQIEGCKWIDAADTTFNEGAVLTLNVKTNHDKFIIHFYGSNNEYSGIFTYSLDGGTPVSVNTANYEGHSTIEINCNDSTHNIVFTRVSGAPMIFGVDMQRTSTGVRVHKLGNKGIKTYGFVIVDEDCWKDSIESLGLDTATILLGTNDGPNSTAVYENMNIIINRIRSVNQYIDLCIIQPSNNQNGYNMTNQSKYQYKVAKEQNTGFINLIPLFGSVNQIIEKGTFYDGLHPTLQGGRMISDYMINKLLP